MSVKPVPEGYHTVTPYLIVNEATRVLEFMKEAFGAAERFLMDAGPGKIGHAEVAIGDSVVMLSDASDRWPAMPGTIHLYVLDCDATYTRALQAGGVSVQAVETQFYGDRSGGVRDPGGNMWWITTHVEDVPAEEMARRAEEWKAKQEG